MSLSFRYYFVNFSSRVCDLSTCSCTSTETKRKGARSEFTSPPETSSPLHGALNIFHSSSQLAQLVFPPSSTFLRASNQRGILFRLKSSSRLFWLLRQPQKAIRGRNLPFVDRCDLHRKFQTFRYNQF